MQSASFLDTCTYRIHGSFVYRYLYNMDNFVNQMTLPVSSILSVCFDTCDMKLNNLLIRRQLLHQLTNQLDPA